MLLMAEVTNEMGAQLRVAAHAQGIPIAVEIGRRLERLERLESEDGGGEMRVDDRMLRALFGSPDGRVTIVSAEGHVPQGSMDPVGPPPNQGSGGKYGR